ncbi:MAG: oligosaccharide flippase family protein [Flavobacteriaceae bacterium]|jgi:O-antigen/teichoic acid export membrane protein|nr:oligosaccharide flippase family protein [Flavobacteriaceae bacterium]HTO35073.1 oligosaccharide flippase family protein [Flavobacterium sp.]
MLRRINQFLFQNKQFQNFSIYGFGQFFNLVTPLLVAPYIIKICGEENFGKTAVGMAIAFFLIVFVEYGSDINGVRNISLARNNREDLEKIFFSTYAVKFILLLIVLSVSYLLILVIPYFSSEKTLFLLSLTVIVGQFINPTWFLQGVENVKWITLLNIISKTIYLIGIFLTIKTTPDYVWVNLWWGSGMILANSFVVYLIIRQYKFFNFKVSKQSVLEYLKKDFSIFYSQIFVSLQMYAPIILVSYFGNNLMAGQYRIVEQIVVIFKTYILLFFNFVYPKVCFFLENDYHQGIRNWKIFNGSNLVFITLCTLLVIYFADDIVLYFNAENTEQLGDVLRIAAFIPFLLAISIPLKQLVLGWNFQKFYVRITTFVVILNLLLIIIILPYYKVEGVFYTLILSEILAILFYLYCIKNNFLGKKR